MSTQSASHSHAHRQVENLFENLPPSLRAEDNEAGWQLSLEQLARRFEWDWRCVLRDGRFAASSERVNLLPSCHPNPKMWCRIQGILPRCGAILIENQKIHTLSG